MGQSRKLLEVRELTEIDLFHRMLVVEGVASDHEERPGARAAIGLFTGNPFRVYKTIVRFRFPPLPLGYNFRDVRRRSFGGGETWIASFSAPKQGRSAVI